MPEAMTITKEFMELLDGIADDGDFRKVLHAVWDFAIAGKEPDELSPIGKCVFMTIKKRIMERNRKRSYIAKKRRETSTVASTVPSTVPSDVDAKNVYSRRSDDLFEVSSNQHMNNSIFPSCIDKSIHCSPTDEKPSNRQVFKVPTLEEVKAYIREKGYSVDAEEFYSFYESNGWHVGKNKMRDWHKAVSYWQCRINNRNKTRAQLRDYSGI